MNDLNDIVYNKILKIHKNNPLVLLPNKFGGKPYLDIPQMGVVDGNDTIFEEFKKELGTEHLYPSEFWKLYGCPSSSEIIHNLTVLVMVYPYTKEIKKTKGISRNYPSKIFYIAQNYARYFITDASEQLCAFLRTMGYLAINPTLSPIVNTGGKDKTNGIWNERNYAYAAGLGTLSLQNALITVNGCNNRIGSIITNAPLEITPRLFDGFNSLCSFYRIHSCGTCKKRCPADAISNEGLDLNKCVNYCNEINKEMNEIIEPYFGKNSSGKKVEIKPSKDFPVGCALCQIKVPCTSRIPLKLQLKVGKNNLFNVPKKK